MEIIKEGNSVGYDLSVKNYKWSVWNEVFEISNGVVCFNTLSGAIYLFQNEEYRKFKCDNTLTDGYADSLLRDGILVPYDMSERANWLTKYKDARHSFKSADITICVTNKCQFKCVYCFEGHKKKAISMQEKTIEQIKTYIAETFPDIDELYLTWFGGEPLIGIKQIVVLSKFLKEYCNSKGAKYFAYMTTNGYGLTPNNYNILNNECSIRSYTITIDGPEKIHDSRRPLLSGKGTYSVIWKNMENAVSKGAAIALRVTVDKTNVGSVYELIDNIANSNLKGKVFVCFARTFDYSFTPDNITKTIFNQEEFAKIEIDLLKYAEQKGVSEILPPWASPLGGCIRDADITIGVNGEIYKCLDTIGEEEWIVGNINKNSKEYEKEWYNEWQSWMPSDSNTCANCKLLPLCNGGCPHNALFSQKKHNSMGQCPDWKYNYKKKIEIYINNVLNKRNNAC